MFDFFYKLWGEMGFLPLLGALEPMPRKLLRRAIDKETIRLAKIISLGLIIFYSFLLIMYIFFIETEGKQALLIANTISLILVAIFFFVIYQPFALQHATSISVIAALIPFTSTLHRLYILEELVITIGIIIGILALATVAIDALWLFFLVTYICIGWFIVINQVGFPIDFNLYYYAIALLGSGVLAIFICRMRFHNVRNYSNLRWHESLQRDELEEAQKHLKVQNAELTHVDELKSVFLANMSHEFRTPLTAINGFAEVLQAESFGPLTEKQSDYLDNIAVSGKQLLDLVNNILSLSSFEANHLPIRLAWHSISEVVQTSLSVLKQDIDQKKIQVKLSLEAEDTAYFDLVLINQVMLNLLSNAIKFSNDNSIIEIKSYDKTNSIIIEVIDLGVGISKENQSLLFLPFSQVDSSFNKNHQGAGLGLALCKQIIEKHGREIFVRSELSKGSTFGFSLPKVTNIDITDY